MEMVEHRERNADARTAMVVMATYQVHTKKRLRLEQFMPRRGTEAKARRRRQSPAQMLRRVEMINAAMGGRDLRGDRGSR